MANSRLIFFPIATIVLLALLLGPSLQAETAAQRAGKHFLSARTQFQNDRDSFEAAWKFGRACFDWAEFAQSDASREDVANQGIEACRRAVLLRPKSVEGRYYLAMNFGQLARTKTLGALKLVEEMEKEFKLTRDIDENFDFSGPDRNLGLLYFEAPRWPTSIGNRSKARHHFERSAKLSPNYPENRLNLLEAYLKWGDKNGAQREFNAIEKTWGAAKKEFSGNQWESSWTDWEKRRGKIEIKFIESPKKFESPRQKK